MVYYFLNWQSAKCMVSVSIAKDGLILALLVQAKNLYGLGPRSIGGTAIAWRCQCLKNQSIFSDLKLTVVMNIKTDSIKLLPKFCRSFLSVGKRHWFPNKKHYLNLITPHLSTLLHYIDVQCQCMDHLKVADNSAIKWVKLVGRDACIFWINHSPRLKTPVISPSSNHRIIGIFYPFSTW